MVGQRTEINPADLGKYTRAQLLAEAGTCAADAVHLAEVFTIQWSRGFLHGAISTVSRLVLLTNRRELRNPRLHWLAEAARLHLVVGCRSHPDKASAYLERAVTLASDGLSLVTSYTVPAEYRLLTVKIAALERLQRPVIAARLQKRADMLRSHCGCSQPPPPLPRERSGSTERRTILPPGPERLGQHEF